MVDPRGPAKPPCKRLADTAAQYSKQCSLPQPWPSAHKRHRLDRRRSCPPGLAHQRPVVAYSTACLVSSIASAIAASLLSHIFTWCFARANFSGASLVSIR